jgi:hypothetical protein
MTDDTHIHLDRALDVLVYAPLGAGLLLLESAPALVEACVARGKAELERRQEQVVHHATSARGMGQFAWTYGLPKARNRARQRLTKLGGVAGQFLQTAGGFRARPTAPLASAAPSAPAAPSPTAAPPVVHRTSDATTTTTGNGAHPSTTTGPAPTSSELPIPGYDALSASQVVERLAGLADEELEAVRAYEESHRNRRTILGKIEQLESPSV